VHLTSNVDEDKEWKWISDLIILTWNNIFSEELTEKQTATTSILKYIVAINTNIPTTCPTVNQYPSQF